MNTVARELGVDAAEVREMEARLAAQDPTFEASADDDDRDAPVAPVYYLEDKSSDLAVNVEEENWESHANRQLAYAMASLDERSQHIIRSRWLDDNKATLQDLADMYGVSAERIRQLEKNALKKLKLAVGDDL